MNTRIILLLMAAGLAACSGSGKGLGATPAPDPDGADADTAAPVPAGGDSPATPAPVSIAEDRSEDLAGSDADGNGIRDDIDHLIASQFSARPDIRAAAEQKARALRQMLLATTREEALAAGRQIARASSCVYRILPFEQPGAVPVRDAMSREIESLTANTRTRLRQYLAANRLAGGGYFSQPPEPVCD